MKSTCSALFELHSYNEKNTVLVMVWREVMENVYKQICVEEKISGHLSEEKLLYLNGSYSLRRCVKLTFLTLDDDAN